MNIRQRTALVATTIALGGGLALAPGASAAPAGPAASVQSDSTAFAAKCPYNGGHPTISRGSRGPAVKHAQCLLNKVWGWGNRVAIDGIFGAKTEYAVKVSQRNCNKTRPRNIAVDGIVGPNTWKVLHPDTNYSFCH